MREGWEYKKLGEVCTFTQGMQVPIEEQSLLKEDGFVRFLRIIDFTQGKEEPRYVRCTNDKYILHNNEIAIVRYGTPGFVCYGKIGAIANNLFKITPNQDYKFNSKFLVYWLNSNAFQLAVRNNQYGVALQAIKFSTIHGISIPIPPLSEQQRIVSELDLLTGIIDKKKAQLKEYDQLAQSIFYDMFGDLLKENPNTTLKDIATYYIGLTYKPTDVSEEGTIVLRSSNIQNNILDFNDIVRVSLNVGDNKIVKDGDILMCARNGSARLVGKVARIRNIEEKMSFGAFMTIIRSNYNDYLFHFFLSDFFRSQLSTSKTATINQITSKMLDKIKLNVPPLPLQQSFAEKIEAIEKQKSLVQQSIVETQTMFDYTMDKYFG